MTNTKYTHSSSLALFIDKLNELTNNKMSFGDFISYFVDNFDFKLKSIATYEMEQQLKNAKPTIPISEHNKKVFPNQEELERLKEVKEYAKKQNDKLLKDMEERANQWLKDGKMVRTASDLILEKILADETIYKYRNSIEDEFDKDFQFISVTNNETIPLTIDSKDEAINIFNQMATEFDMKKVEEGIDENELEKVINSSDIGKKLDTLDLFAYKKPKTVSETSNTSHHTFSRNSGK